MKIVNINKCKCTLDKERPRTQKKTCNNCWFLQKKQVGWPTSWDQEVVILVQIDECEREVYRLWDSRWIK